MGTKTILRNLWIFVALAGVGVMVYAAVQMAEAGQKAYTISWWASGLFVILTVPISLFSIILHLNNYTDPIAQRYVIRIIWMAPVYALDSWLALRFKDTAIYLDVGRECYEAYVIYSFTFFLIHMVGKSRVEDLRSCTFEHTSQACATIMSQKQQQPHITPMCCLPPWRMGVDFIRKCKNGVLFYCLSKVLTAAATFVMELEDVYGNGEFDFKKGYIYCTIINNFAQLWALYCLVMFYHACAEELKPFRPLPKFICIKAVVFFSFWQSVAIAVLVYAGVIDEKMAEWVGYSRDDSGVEDLGIGLQDFLICIEMFVAAIAHMYAFSHEDFKLPDRPVLTRWQKVREVFNVADVRQDMYGHIKEVGTDVVTLPVIVGKRVQKQVRRVKRPGEANKRLLEPAVALAAGPEVAERDIIDPKWPENNVHFEPDES